MSPEEAENVCIEAMVRAHKGQIVKSDKYFKAIRILMSRDARELYESLSEEFVRRGVASNRFSELEQLFNIARTSLKDYRDLANKLQTQNEIIELLKEVTELAAHIGIDCGYGVYTAEQAKEKAREALVKINSMESKNELA